MTPVQTQDDEDAGDQALERRAARAAAPDQWLVALFRRHETDPEFRAAVDDMTAATGLCLPASSLGPELDEVVHLARYKREQARLEAPRR